MAQQNNSQNNSKKKQNQTSTADSSNTHVRGKDLRAQMIESAEYGEEFRASHQGSDVIESQVTSNIKPDSGRPKESSRK